VYDLNVVCTAVATATTTAHCHHSSSCPSSSTSHRTTQVSRRSVTGSKEWVKMKCWCACFLITWCLTSTSSL